MEHDRSSTVVWAWEYEDPVRPRPREVRLLESFLNTVDHHRFGAHATKPDDQRDLLATPEGMGRWLASWGRAVPGTVGTPEMQRARAVRDALRVLLVLRQAPGDDDAGAPERLSLPRGLHLEVGLDGSVPTLRPVPAGIDGVLSGFLADLVVAHATGALDRLKICLADDCRFVYYDHSRSRSSRWCSTATCGNRIKTRNYRRRRR